MHLTKHHGLGNEFLVILDENNTGLPPIDGDLARRLCHRADGYGADGLIHGARSTSGDAEVVMHLFNSDGSRAEMSGNGVRCLAQAVAVARGDHALHLVIATDAGDRATIVESGDDLQSAWVHADMGRAGPGPTIPDDVAERVGGQLQTVDVGNPHLVVLGPDPHTVDLATEGPWIGQRFVEGINVEYVAIDDPKNVTLTVWERGAGITEACGTGACAAAYAANEWGLVGDEVEVHMPGGSASVTLGDTMTLASPVHLVRTVEVDDG